MASRLIQVACPKDRREAVLDAARENDRWVVDAFDSDGRSLVRIVAPEEAVEALLDALQERLGPISDDGPPAWSIIVVHVEATLPRQEDLTPPGEESAPAPEDEPEQASNKGRLSREELYEDIESGSRLRWSYALFVALATVVALAGLLQGNSAVVVAAMVVAPLLGPNMALALAATLGDLRLGGRALVATALGFLLAVGLSALLAQAAPLDPEVREVALRTRATPTDIALALAAGVAGAMAFLAGGGMSVVGVMVAVALLPPTVVLGAMLGQGQWSLAMGALVLTLLNIAAVNLAGVATFLVRGVRPRDWCEHQRALRIARVVLTGWILLMLGLSAAVILLSGSSAAD